MAKKYIISRNNCSVGSIDQNWSHQKLTPLVWGSGLHTTFALFLKGVCHLLLAVLESLHRVPMNKIDNVK